jgi:acetyl esterase/lipase
MPLRLLGALSCALLPFVAAAQPSNALLRQATDGTLPLYEAPPPVPGAQGPEQWMGEDMTALAVRNVVTPTLMPVLPPPDQRNGAGVIVVPGGALVAVAMGNEGMLVAERLAERGISAFVLKYRTVPTPRDPAGFASHVQAGLAAFRETGPASALEGEAVALADAHAALRMVEDRASGWGVDPDRLGMLGFSAGAITVLNVVLAEGPGAGPDFAGLLYGRMAAVTPPEDAPPLFVALAADDPLFGDAGFGLVDSWRVAGAPVELHYYARGGHGFGAARQGATSDAWLDQFLQWLEMQGTIPVAQP